MHDRKAGIGDRGSRFDRFRVTIKRNEARIRSDAGKNGTAVPAAAESGVDENTVALPSEEPFGEVLENRSFRPCFLILKR